MLHVYEVGKKITEPGYDGVFFDITDGGAVMTIRMGSPTAKEKRAFKSGISLRYAVVDDIIFILARMGTLEWMDAPYYIGLSQNLTHLDRPKEGEGLAIHILLVDGNTGILAAQKLMSLTTQASLKLIDAVEQQKVIPDYDSRLHNVMVKYDTDDLLKKGIVLC